MTATNEVWISSTASIKKTVKSAKAYYSDVDDTLAMGNLSDYPETARIKVPYINGDVEIVPNKKMINLLTYFYKLGYDIIVWSRTGGDWAEAVGKALEIDHMVAAYLPKPLFYGDDQPVEQWMGPRRYRDNKETKND